MPEVRRYERPVGLAIIDIDSFASVSDTDAISEGSSSCATSPAILRETSRDADVAVRYGGEEMVLILPHTDLEGTYESAERVTTAIQATNVPRRDGDGGAADHR